MGTDKVDTDNTVDLRTEAESKVAAQAVATESLGDWDVKRLYHELQVHKFELEMQNKALSEQTEELSSTITRLEQEISERKKVEQALQYERDLSMDIINAQPAGIYRIRVFAQDTWEKDAWLSFKNSPHLIELASEPFCKILGTTKEALVNNPGMIIDLIDPEDRNGFAKKNEEAAVLLEEFFWEGRIIIDGVIRWVRFQSLPRTLENGDVLWTGALTDITEHKHAEKELLQSKVAAESANRTKSQFLATMSHEIRTPMNGILGMAQILQMTELSEEQQEYVDLITSSGKNLLNLISDILDLSRIEAGRIELELSDFCLSNTICSSASIFSLLAKDKGLAFSSLIDPDVPLMLRGDAERLRQIISNLVGNAIKFTSEGYISLHCSKDAEDEQHATLRFEVFDSGIGIAPDHIESIFEPFKQADSSTSRKFGGTGLGLTIARHLATLMGGTLGVESREGAGTTFWFTVVLGKQEKIPAGFSLEKKEHLSGVLVRRVAGIPLLLVEDDPANQFAISRLLSKTGYQVDVANDGSEGLKMLEENNYSLVLMDCMMPVMDGYIATAVIRNQTSKVRNHAIPVIALTANAMREDHDKCLAAGMDDYLSKPVEYSVLVTMLEKWIKQL